ncbi:hypothetical protein ACMFMG_005170 [Clarireedia jacksonii]
MRYSTIAAILSFTSTAFAFGDVNAGGIQNVASGNGVAGGNSIGNVGGISANGNGANGNTVQNVGANKALQNAEIVKGLAGRDVYTTIYSTTFSTFATTYTTAYTSTSTLTNMATTTMSTSTAIQTSTTSTNVVCISSILDIVQTARATVLAKINIISGLVASVKATVGGSSLASVGASIGGASVGLTVGGSNTLAVSVVANIKEIITCLTAEVDAIVAINIPEVLSIDVVVAANVWVIVKDVEFIVVELVQVLESLLVSVSLTVDVDVQAQIKVTIELLAKILAKVVVFVEALDCTSCATAGQADLIANVKAAIGGVLNIANPCLAKQGLSLINIVL